MICYIVCNMYNMCIYMPLNLDAIKYNNIALL